MTLARITPNNRYILRLASSLFLVLAFLLAGFNLKAQAYNKESEKLMLKLKSKYAGKQSFSGEYEIKIKYPDEDPQIIPGKFWSSGDKYKVDMANQMIVCNATSQWIFDKEDNEVNIYDAEDSEMNMSPSAIFELFGNDEYAYAATNSYSANGKQHHEIEFKPNDATADFSKARLTITQPDLAIKTLETFYKDGSRISVVVKSMDKVKLEDTVFNFDPKDHGNPTVEDLRW